MKFLVNLTSGASMLDVALREVHNTCAQQEECCCYDIMLLRMQTINSTYSTRFAMSFVSEGGVTFLSIG
jgi:hypothetical protein